MRYNISQLTASRLAGGLASSTSRKTRPASSPIHPFLRPLSDGRFHSFILLSCLANLRQFIALIPAVLGTGAALPSPHVSRIGHPIHFPSTAFIQHHQVGIPINRILNLLAVLSSRNRRRRNGDRNIETDAPYTEDEAAAPAFRPDRGQRSQGSTPLIFTHVCRKASSYQCHTQHVF
jgi:hypothetical protein